MRFSWQATVACAVAGASGIVNAATADQWRGRAIYQVLTDRYARTDGGTDYKCVTNDGKYCGGTWQGIIKRLDYIRQMGFTAIWISPVTHNLEETTAFGQAYHGYWQQDLYKLNAHFGTADDLKALSKALHDRGMYLMVDVVTNHFGWNGTQNTVNYGKLAPFNDAKYFHSYCIVSDWSNQTEVEKCWLGDPRVELPDLRTEDQTVVDHFNHWIHELVANYSIDGLRIDTVKHVDKNFWSGFQSAAGVFCTGEVLSTDAAYACGYQGALESVLDYPLYDPMMMFLNSTTGQSTKLLEGLKINNASCKDSTLLGTFSENHDLPRFASQTQDLALAKNVLTFTIMSDGIPIVYAGQEQRYAGQQDPYNREATWLSNYNQNSDLYKLTASLNQVRNRAISIDPNYLKYNIWPIYNDTNTVAFRKGFDGKQIISVITNKGDSGNSYTQTVQKTGWASGTKVIEILSCATATVGDSGKLDIPMNKGQPMVYFSADSAKGSGICGNSASTYSSPSVSRSQNGGPNPPTKSSVASTTMTISVAYLAWVEAVVCIAVIGLLWL